jgi:hypothetical protein
MVRIVPYSVEGNSGDLSFQVVLLQIIVVLMSLFDIAVTFRDMWSAFRTDVLVQHLMSPAVWLEWTSHTLQIYYWTLWIGLTEEIQLFRLKPIAAYAPLSMPNGEARWLASDADGELNWLRLVLQLQSMLASEERCYSILGFALLVYLFRFLAACHFQPKWANVTGTMLSMIPDTVNYLILYLLVIGGYACVAMQLFGHQFEGMSSFGNALQMLVNYQITCDYTQLWSPMQHAAYSDLTFQLYMWTFMVIGNILMFNIFCCIVIDGYMTSKAEMEGTMTTSVGQDLASTSKMLYDMLSKTTKVFWSDGHLKNMLQARVEEKGLPSMSKLREHINKAFASHAERGMTLKSPGGGIGFSKNELKRLTKSPEPTKLGFNVFSCQQLGKGTESLCV